MSFNLNTLRSRLAEAKSSGVVKRALEMLDSQGIRASALNPVHSRADELLQLWRTREQIAQHRGTLIPGIAYLNARLSELAPEAMVEQYNFDNEKWGGSIFIDPATGDFLGDSIVKRRPKSRQMQELEAQLIRPSRKTA
jgi:hypothetical protein